MPGKTGAGGSFFKTLGIMLGACLGVSALLATSAFAQKNNNAPTEMENFRLAAPSQQTPLDAGEIALPPVLGESDRTLYGQIFMLQQKGELGAAAKLISKLKDEILMGHVLAQKYLHPTAHRSKFNELKLWLNEYADHPDARRLYRLAMKRKPTGVKAPKPPIATNGAGLSPAEGEYALPRIPRRSINRDQRNQLLGLQRDMRARIRRGWPTGASQILASKAHSGLASEAEYDAYQARIAWSYYLHNKDALAYELASASAARSRQFVPDADWTAGLAEWRLGRLETAVGHFAKLAHSPTASPWLITSGAYWAARGELRLRRPQYVSYWLKIAAQKPRTFYGLLATRALGLKPDLNWRSSVLTEAHLAVLDRSMAVRRARALAEVDQDVRAEKEIRVLWPRASSALASAILPLANRLGLATIQIALGTELRKIDGETHDGAAFPLPGWQPKGGYIIDRALIFALIRQESKFKATARNRSGARGLMQLMPGTARFAARQERITGVNSHTLLNPELNIALGQSYVQHLLTQDVVDGNIFFLLCAYNAGPGNLKKWLPKTNFNEDPLLFIESIRSRETRQFIERVIANYWIYRMRLRQPTPSLDATASGLWPNYSPQERNFSKNE